MKVAIVLPFLMVASMGAALIDLEEFERPRLERVSITERADQQGYVVRLHLSDRVPAYSEARRTTGTTTEIILFNTERARRIREDAASGPLERYAVRAEGNHVKFEMHFDASVPVVARVYRDRGSPDLLISLSPRNDSPAVAQDAPPVIRTSDAAPARTVSAGERWRLDKVVIDAGHGGKDHGAVANGVREKDVVLEVARRLGQYIEDNLDVEVIYTRTDDRFIELHNRGRVANDAGAKLFISIHANSAPNRAAHGTETFFLGPYKSEEARRVMEKENRVVEMESNPEKYEGMDETALIRQTLAYSSFVRSSQELADIIEHQFAERVGRSSRGVKQAPFYVLWSASMPSVLVELGFLTNRNEAAFLASDDGQTYLASAIFRAVREYKERYERGLNLVRTD